MPSILARCTKTTLHDDIRYAIELCDMQSEPQQLKRNGRITYFIIPGACAEVSSRLASKGVLHPRAPCMPCAPLMRRADLTDRRRILLGIILHMEAFQFHELLEAEATQGLSFPGVLPACPGKILLQLVIVQCRSVA